MRGVGFCASFKFPFFGFPEKVPRGRKNDQPRVAKPHGYWGLVPSTLKFLKIDSLYVHTGEAVSCNCRTARAWRLWVSRRYGRNW